MLHHLKKCWLCLYKSSSRTRVCRFHICALIHDIYFSLSDLLHCVWSSLCPSTSLKMTSFLPCYGEVIFNCICASCLVYPFLCWWTFGLLPCPGYCRQCCNEHWGTWIFWNYGFFLVYAPEAELLGRMVVLFLVSLRNLHGVLHSGFTSLHSYQQC